MRLDATLTDLLATHGEFLEAEVGKGTVRVDSVRNLMLAFDTARGEYQSYVRAIWSPWTLEGREPIRSNTVAAKLGVCLFHLLTLTCFAPHLQRATELEKQLGAFEADSEVKGLTPIRAASELCAKGASLGVEGFLFHATRNLHMYDLSMAELLDAYENVLADVRRGSMDMVQGG